MPRGPDQTERQARQTGMETPAPSLRTSSYTIYVDLPDSSSEILLVHGYSGAYDVVSADVANYVRSLETRRPPRPLFGQWSPEPPAPASVPPVSDATLGLLRRRGYLTEMDEAQEEQFFAELVGQLQATGALARPGILFMPTYDCNLRCGYCFQDHMRTDPAFGHLLKIMTRPVADQIFAVLPEVEARHGVTDVATAGQSITFFGGEPLLERTRPIVEYIMGRAAERGPATFHAVTNGTELGAYRDLLGPAGLSSLQITLDGPPGEHDGRRIHADGTGSFDAIAANITMALDRGAYVEVRTNVDRLNIGRLPELAAEIIRQGWHRYPNFGAYTAVITAANDKTARRTTMSSWELDKRLTEMRSADEKMHVLGRPDDGLVSRIRSIIEQREDPFGSFRANYCGAHAGMYLFDPFGDIYACWERTGDSRVRVGHVQPDGQVSWAGLMAMWKQRTVASNPVCRQCRFALYCGGGCAINAVRQSGEFFSNYCDGFAARFRASAAEAYTDFRAGRAVAEPAASFDRLC